MELRTPPTTSTPAPARDGALRTLAFLNLIVLVAAAVFFYLRSGTGDEVDPAAAEHARDVASKLKAAGALDEAATLYEVYLKTTDADAKTRANVAYSLGNTYLESGRYERALRWFYEAEDLGVGSLSDQLSKKIVHTLERLGRYHSAKAALGARAQFTPQEGDVKRSENDPVVAKIDGQEIYRSEVMRTLDDLPPEMASQLSSKPEELLKKYVADELMWRKAVKLEYDKDPEVRRRYEALLKQLAISKFVENEVVKQIKVDPADLQNYFEANRSRYEKEGEKLEKMPPEVERDYRMSKIQSAYSDLVEQELSTDKVELFAERMADGQ